MNFYHTAPPPCYIKIHKQLIISNHKSFNCYLTSVSSLGYWTIFAET